MRDGRVQEPPVLPVLQQQVRVDEQDAGDDQGGEIPNKDDNDDQEGEHEEKQYNHDKDDDKHDYSPGVIEAAAVVFEVSRSGDDRSWIVLVVFIVILGVEDIVEHVLLHLANLRVAVDPSLRIQIPHDLC